MQKPKKNSPEWHQLRIAKRTLKLADPIIGVIGGMTKVQARRIVAQYQEEEE